MTRSSKHGVREGPCASPPSLPRFEKILSFLYLTKKPTIKFSKCEHTKSLFLTTTWRWNIRKPLWILPTGGPWPKKKFGTTVTVEWLRIFFIPLWLALAFTVLLILKFIVCDGELFKCINLGLKENLGLLLKVYQVRFRICRQRQEL